VSYRINWEIHAIDLTAGFLVFCQIDDDSQVIQPVSAEAEGSVAAAPIWNKPGKQRSQRLYSWGLSQVGLALLLRLNKSWHDGISAEDLYEITLRVPRGGTRLAAGSFGVAGVSTATDRRPSTARASISARVCDRGGGTPGPAPRRSPAGCLRARRTRATTRSARRAGRRSG
jgi:hypothetical protein